MRYGKLYKSEELITDTGKTSGDYIRIFEGKPRPTPKHICSPDGLWILPESTVEAVEVARRLRYAEETDDLKEHILSDQMLGKPAAVTDPKLAEWQGRVNQIKQDLPYPEKKQVQSHYQPVIDKPL
ncbi:hypothetical protein NVP1179O_15 [Vibrio phage 1.179.O._10N.286.45.F12]|nr:hypothetical protein NVP1179O_15 [Vibrio phage 1.179.O._10N.286.45.F12]AUR98930.1 hypothetical protein NVP1257O_15 [Vibrio phage 1.257.O._10N.286.46.A4]